MKRKPEELLEELQERLSDLGILPDRTTIDQERLSDLGILPDRTTIDQLPDQMIKSILSQLDFDMLLTFHGYYALKTSTRVRLLIDDIFKEKIFQTLGAENVNYIMEKIPKSVRWKDRFLPYWRHFYVAMMLFKTMTIPDYHEFVWSTDKQHSLVVHWDEEHKDILIMDQDYESPLYDEEFASAIVAMINRIVEGKMEASSYGDMEKVTLSEIKDVYMIGIMFGLLYEFDFSIGTYQADPERRTPLIRSCISCQQPANYQCSKCPRATFCGSEKCSEKHFQINHEC